MVRDSHEIDEEDEIFEEIAEEEDSELNSDTALLDDESEDEFVQDAIDPDDLQSGFSATVPMREIDVDEDTQGDEGPDVSEEPLSQFEASGTASRSIHGDEIELDLDEALRTGRTVARAPDED